ncbi:MAG: cadherin-like domain-containing protein, partial [Chloroflexota bacterium]
VNDAPVAVDDAVSVDEDSSVNIDAVANDTDVDTGDILQITAVGTASNGSVVLENDGTITYTPNPDFNGSDSFTYTVSDGELTAEGTVTVTVGNANDAPVAVDDLYGMLEDGTLSIGIADGVLDNDTDIDGDTLTAILVSDVS